VACAASPISSVRLRDHVGNVATSSVAVTTIFSAASSNRGRLEKAGLVRRERDESDRRKVFIATVPENIAKVGKFYEHMQRGPEGLGELFGYGAAAAASIHDAGLQDDAGGDRGAQGDDGAAEGQARRVYEACADAVSAL
jgi:hypothetical protein